MINPLLAARRAKDKEKLKNSILSSAKQIVEKEGIECITIRRIASEIQYSLPVIYTLFRDKDDILECLAKDYLDYFYSRLKDNKLTITFLKNFITVEKNKWDVIDYFPVNLINLLDEIEKNQ